MKTEITALLNKQINMELYSAYLYLDMSDYYSAEGLAGFANWYYVQTQEERDHAMLMRTFLLNNDEKVKLESIAAPDLVFKSFNDPLVGSLAHEKLVTASIYKIYAAAQKFQDFRTAQFLDWFVQEQGEEEKNATDNLRNYELFGGDAKGLYLLDQQMGTRVYSAPSLVL